MAGTAKILMHGRSQAGRLPKGFRLPDEDFRVSRVGHTVILEPLEKPSFDDAVLRAELAAAGARAFLPEGLPEDEPAGRDDDVSFD